MQRLIIQMQKAFEIGCVPCEALELWSFGVAFLSYTGGGSLWCLEYGVVPPQLSFLMDVVMEAIGVFHLQNSSLWSFKKQLISMRSSGTVITRSIPPHCHRRRFVRDYALYM